MYLQDARGAGPPTTLSLTIKAGVPEPTFQGGFGSAALYEDYSVAVNIAGGVGPIDVVRVDGQFPPGLQLYVGDSFFALFGTLTSVGTFSFTMQATVSDSASIARRLRRR